MAHGKNWRSWPFNIPGFLKTLFDPYAHAVAFIEEEHRLVHDGMVFDTDVLATSVANGASVTLQINIPAGLRPHLRQIRVAADDGPCTLELYEDSTVTVSGTLQDSRNHNRNSSNTALMTVLLSPTVTVLGTLLHRSYLPAAGAPGSNPGGFVIGGQSQQEFVMHPNQNAVLRITNNSGGAINISLEVLWYELSYLDEEA